MRVDRHRAKLLAFRFRVIYQPGHQKPSDYGSRNPRKVDQEEATTKGELGKEGKEEDAEFAVNRVMEEDLPGAITMDMMKRETEKDLVLQGVKADIERGHMGQATEGSEYSKVFSELTSWEGLILKGERLVVPPKLRAEVIALAHETHGLGVSRTVRLLRERVWFPKLAHMTKEYIASCLPCSAAVLGNPPAPIVIQEMPERPWQVLEAD